MCRAFAEQIARLPCLLAQIAIFVKAEALAGSAAIGRDAPMFGVAIRRRLKAGAWRTRHTTCLCNSLRIFEYVSSFGRGEKPTSEGRSRLAGLVDAPGRLFSLHLS
jgi:hypothetical protein